MTRRTTLLAAAFSMLLQAAAIAQVAAPADRFDQTIREKLQVSAYSIARLDLPHTMPEDGLALKLNLGGQEWSLDLSYDPVQTPDCEMLLDDGSGKLHAVPAPPSCTFSGHVTGLEGSIASGSIVGHRLTGIVLFPDGLGAYNILPLSEVIPDADPALHVISAFDDGLPGEWTCATTHLHETPDHRRAAPVHPASGAASRGHGHTDAPILCELAIEADYPYFQLVGGTASTVAQDIATVIINVSNYSRHSGADVRFRVVRYVIRVTSAGNPGLYNTSNPDTLLQGFRTVWNNLAGFISRDTAHMFTGRDLQGTNIGIAYLSSVCSPLYGYGISQSRFHMQPGRRAALTAHELGHNLSANHCDANPNVCGPCWLMLTTQGSTTNQLTRFGCSNDIIRLYAESRPCIGPLPLTAPSPGPCPPDFDRSGALSPADFAAYQQAFAANDPAADLDHDGRLTINDAMMFMHSFAAGCP